MVFYWTGGNTWTEEQRSIKDAYWGKSSGTMEEKNHKV